LSFNCKSYDVTLMYLILLNGIWTPKAWLYVMLCTILWSYFYYLVMQSSKAFKTVWRQFLLALFIDPPHWLYIFIIHRYFHHFALLLKLFYQSLLQSYFALIRTNFMLFAKFITMFLVLWWFYTDINSNAIFFSTPTYECVPSGS
jgi:hypothetical protein